MVFSAILVLVGVYFLAKTFPPKVAHAANFTTAKASPVNSRFSYKAGVASGTTGTSVVTIDASGNADNTTSHLFPGDEVCFTDVLQNGCLGNKTYTVANIASGDVTFNLTTPLTDTLLADGYVIATQSGVITLTFTTGDVIPIGGDLYITIPTVDTTGKTNDAIPDTGTTISVNGFDQGKIVAGDITAPSANCTQWDTVVVTSGDASNDLRIQIPKITATCAAGSALTVILGGTNKLVNPAPATTSHTRGVADAYQINIKSRDGSGNTIDSSDVTISPVDGVFVSATVDETLALTIAQIQTDAGSYCGVTRTANSPDTTATSVPWGTISSTYLAATHNTNQQITVSTNASGGYSLYIEENDQMGKEGNTCTGTTPSAGNYTFTAGTCIRDSVCQSSNCSESTETDWTDMATYVGLGFSMEDTSGTDATFEFDDTATFKARQIADVTEGAETRAAIMTNAGPVAGSSAYICYRIAITGLQPAGYYYNKIRFTAIPIF